MNIFYNQNYTIERIEEILESIQECVRRNRYIISRNANRQENDRFLTDYNLTSVKQRSIFMGIRATDFCHSLQNTNVGFEHEVLFVFCPQTRLHNFDGREEQVDIYLKFNILECDEENRMIVISFHKRNKPIAYLFR